MTLMPSPVYSVCDSVCRYISLRNAFIAFVSAIAFVERVEVKNTRTLSFPTRPSVSWHCYFYFRLDEG
jgi:hypothetical protein